MTTLVVVFTGLFVCGQAAQAAGCGVGNSSGVKLSAAFGTGQGALMNTAFVEGGQSLQRAAITGMYTFTFTDDGTHPGGPGAGQLVDSGYVTWHGDGTEIMNSGRAAVAGSFCMGVWKMVGPHTYKVSHWALSWVPDYVPGATSSWTGVPPTGIPGGVDEAFQFAGPTHIQESITLSADGSHYTGTFTLTAYIAVPGGPVTAYDPSKVALVLTGTISGTRVTVE
jgi:hypothetical protein